jgi:hypothetical protein
MIVSFLANLFAWSLKTFLKKGFLLGCCILCVVMNVRADYTVGSGTNRDASTLVGQSGVLTINGTLTVSSNAALSGFTSVVINAPAGQIYWSDNSDLIFSEGTTIDIASGAPGLQSHGNNASQRLIIGNVIIAVSSDHSNAAIFSFDQFNELGGLPEYTSSYSLPVCSGNPFTATVSAQHTVSGVNYSYSWSISPSSGTFAYNSNQSTATITPDAGHYIVTCVASANTYHTEYIFNVNIPLSYTWLGVTSNWSDLSDWCPGVPIYTSSVLIPAGVTTPTIESSTTATVNNLTIASGATLIVKGTLQVKGTITNNGTLDLTNGSLEMNGTLAQNIAGSLFYKNTVKNLIVSNPAGLSVSSTAGDTLKISKSLTFGNASATLSTGDNIDFLSTPSQTASLGAVGPLNTVTGKAIVERYVSVGTGSGQHAKTWQFLAAPTNGQSIRQSWMENGNNVSGYGIWLTGPAGTGGGFDATSLGDAIKTYNPVSNKWEGVSNTNISVHNSTGYMIFIRGDRSVNGTTVATPKPTILRSKGMLVTGNQLPINVLPGQFQSVGNPYPAPIDFTQLSLADGVDNLFYTWDPFLFGIYGYGGYQTLSATNAWVPVPGGTTAYPAGIACTTIQSGQAFFVHATANSTFGIQKPTVSISESSKLISSSNFNFARVAHKNLTQGREFLRTDLLSSPQPGSQVADGNAVAFDNIFSNKVDGDDALKLANSGENFGLKREGKLLVIEAKAPVTMADTIFYTMTGMKRQTYQLRITPVNMQSENLQPFLVDNFLKTSTALNLSDTNFINFSVTSAALSSAANRFSIVFRQMSTLPVTLTSIKATLQNNGVLVDWKTESESGILQYEVQKSSNGISFETSYKTSSSITSLNAASTNYTWFDSQVPGGSYYYRIKTTGIDGHINYSKVVKVSLEKIISHIAVAPNPVADGKINLIFGDAPTGNYNISLTNHLGQVVLSKRILHTAWGASEIISDYSLARGAYNLLIIKPDGSKESLKIIY